MDLLQVAKINTVVVSGLMVICLVLAALWFFCTRTCNRRRQRSAKKYQNYTELKQVRHMFKYFITPYPRLSAKSMQSRASNQSCGSLFIGK